MGIVRLSQSLFAGTAMSLAFAATANATETKVYTYDALGRLIGEVSQGTVNDDDARTYCYDSGGNRILVLAAQSGVTTDCSALDSGAELSIGNATVTEGGSLVFTVTRSGNTLFGASANYVTADGTAVSPADYTYKSDTVSFAAGETSKTISISTVDDSVAESSEAMTVVLSAPSSNTTITDGSGSGTIHDNEPAPANIAIGNASVTEGGTLSFVVTRSGNTSIAASASYATANGTAVAPGDYLSKAGTVSFASGQTSKTITVITIDDAAVESSESMTVALSNPSANVAIIDASGNGTIADNDAVSNSPPVAVDDSTTLFCGLTSVVDIIANDTDPDGDTLTLDSISFVSGYLGNLTIVSSTEIEIVAGNYNNTAVLSYVVKDPAGASDAGIVTVNVRGPARLCSE